MSHNLRVLIPDTALVFEDAVLAWHRSGSAPSLGWKAGSDQLPPNHYKAVYVQISVEKVARAS